MASTVYSVHSITVRSCTQEAILIDVLIPLIPDTDCTDYSNYPKHSTDHDDLWVQQVLYNNDELAVLLATAAPFSACPVCQLDSKRVHSRYRRTLFDLPLASRPVRLQLQVRRFFCPTSDCPRCIFAERLPALTQPYAHRTSRMATALRQIGLALGGQAGARLAANLHLTSSPDTLLRLVRQTEGQGQGQQSVPTPTPRVLGVDDWAKRKGQTYGTILCNLETGAVVDLLPDREAATFATWLRQHPGVQIISRDRGGAYAEGARLGAPDARQVADRFHILCNLGDALEELLGRLYEELSKLYQSAKEPTAASAASVANQQGSVIEDPDTATTTTTAGQAPRPCPVPQPGSGPKRRQRDVALSQARRSARVARYEEVIRLHALGWSQVAIAEHLNLTSKTVRRWLRKGTFPEYKYPAVRCSKLDEHKAYLHKRWEEGCGNAKQMWRELRQEGFRGGHTAVRDYVATLRQLQNEQDEEQEGALSGKVSVSGVPGDRKRRKAAKLAKLPRPRQLKWLLLKPVDKLDDEQYETVLKLCHYSKEVTLAYGLVTDFQDLVRHRKAEQLSNWVGLALASGVGEMVSFARGVQRDFAAVLAGMELEWSQGQVEGHVNRLKMVKRTMFGRANFDLLRIRVLHGY